MSERSMPPTGEANRLVVHRLFDEVLGEQKLSALGEIYHPDAVDHAPYPGAPAGLAGVRHSITKVLNSYSETAYRIDEISGQGETVQVRVHFQGKPTRRLLGRRGTKGAVHTVQQLTFRLADGLITERWAERPVRCPDPQGCGRSTSPATPLPQPSSEERE